MTIHNVKIEVVALFERDFQPGLTMIVLVDQLTTCLSSNVEEDCSRNIYNAQWAAETRFRVWIVTIPIWRWRCLPSAPAQSLLGGIVGLLPTYGQRRAWRMSTVALWHALAFHRAVAAECREAGFGDRDAAAALAPISVPQAVFGRRGSLPGALPATASGPTLSTSQEGAREGRTPPRMRAGFCVAVHAVSRDEAGIFRGGR